MFGRRSNRRDELEERLELVEGSGDELVHTPSVAADLASGMSDAEAAKGQRLREQVRIVDAQIADAKAAIIRQQLLAGPSGRSFVCDGDCVVGGCGETFAEEDGVLCEGCQLFLCHRCFGRELVTNECQVGGRYDKSVDTASGTGMMSAPGSLPCPLYPSDCTCGHIPLASIHRALLHESNRGDDGDFEDIESPGLSPHKIFLIARRRQAETKLTADATDGSLRLRESTLVRTVTEATRATGALDRAMSRARTSTSRHSSARTALADKCDELEQLRDELSRMCDGEAPIPPKLRRLCAQCGDDFTCYEGGECTAVQASHFLCNVCFGGYLMQACSRGGAFEKALENDDGLVVSPAGKLPCPFFRGHDKQLISSERAELPALDCRCGIIESSTIERVLMDPRNNSRSYWREKRASAAIDAQAAAQGVLPGDQAASGPWSVGIELLSREWTPSAVHETARLRVVVQEQQREQQQRNAQGLETGVEEGTLAELSNKVNVALTKGASIQCPQCGVQAIKDDACIHMDTCPCGSSWCFLCGRVSGSSEGQCPRGAGGCDQDTLYLEQKQGWGDFALPGENPSFGAQQEFLRRRQAFYVRQVMEEADPQLWAQLREKSPGLLNDCPTPGRKIEWEDLPTTAFPLFGANVGRDNIDEWMREIDAPADEDAAARFEAHFRREADALRARQMAERRRRYGKVVKAISLVVIAAGIMCLMALFPSDNPRKDLDPKVAPNSTFPEDPSLEEPDCTRELVSFAMKVPCDCGFCNLLFWVPLVEGFVGIVLWCVMICRDDDEEQGTLIMMALVLFAMACWPVFTGPLAHWSVSLVIGPICAGFGATCFFMLPIGDAIERHCEDHTGSIIGCVGVLGYAAYLTLTILARSFAGAHGSIDEEEHLELAEYECAAACWMLRWLLRALAGLGAFGFVTLVHEEWDGDCDNWTSRLIKVPIGLAVCSAIALWPEAVSILSLGTFATGSAWWLYPLLFLSITIVWFLGCQALDAVSNAICNEGFVRLMEDYSIAPLVAALPGTLGCAFLYLYRAGIPEYEGAYSPWATMVHVLITICLVLTILVAAIADEDDDLSGFVGFMLFLSVILWGADADALQEIWILVCLCIFFSGWVVALCMVLGAIAEDEACWNTQCVPQCFACFSCLALLSLNVGMITAFLISATTEMPPAFEVSGADEWQMGNFSTVNGIYHLRVDLRDGKAGSLSSPPGPECSDSWITCQWRAAFIETDGHIDGIDDDCLSQVKGSFIYQRHDDVASPGTDSLLLYRPKHEHLWVVAPGRLAYQSCFASTAAYLHSPPDICARRPDGSACAGKWKQALPDGKWNVTNSTRVVPDQCEDPDGTPSDIGDMCCDVECVGLPCENQFRAGAWAGVCANGTVPHT